MSCIALAGNPNCGKTALFNALTGGRAKVGNYPGVTVERKEGIVRSPSGKRLRVIDLPGTYSLDARTPDERVTRDVLFGDLDVDFTPQVLLAVADATNLERNLGLVLELKALGRPVVLALNMMDLARSRGLELDLETLSRELGVAVVPTVAIRREGVPELLGEIERCLPVNVSSPDTSSSRLGSSESSSPLVAWRKPTSDEVRGRFGEVDRILKAAIRKSARPTIWTDRIDRIVLHPVTGPFILLAVLVVLFQAIFTWAKIPQEWISGGIEALGHLVERAMPDGPLRSLLVDGVIAGVGSVLVFLPQILLLFLFILLLEDSGYMARAAYLMDRWMGRVGLHGRAFIPLLSSHACAIPGIMATRTIENPRDRLATILVAPLTTCSARLPIYSLLIGAFISNQLVWGPFRLQGLVMLGLYAAGILSALVMAWVFRATLLRGKKPPLLMELPTYKWPSPRSIGVGLVERAQLFVYRAGTVIFSLSVLLWFLTSYPKAPVGSDPALPAIHYSYAGRIGHAIEPVLKPLGFDWRVGIALIPGFAAREVMVSALSTVYAVETRQATASEGAGDKVDEQTLGAVLKSHWSLATAISLLVWYILACQCLSTLAVTRRETNSWRWPLLMLGYMTALAYGGSFLAYRGALLLGWG